MVWVVIGLMWLPWAALAAWVARQIGRGQSVNNDALSAEERVRRSYADGRIDRQQFGEMMADLASGSAAAGN